jgi:branched-chain amino acid transport system substrate-binding protein
VRKAIILILVVMLLGGGLGCRCCCDRDTNEVNGDTNEVRDRIVIGQAVSLSGPLAFMHENTAGPVQELWVEEVNAAGGIYVEEYGRKLPIDLIVYDDASDVATMVRLVEKLIVEDEVDLLLSPCGTDFIHAAAPVANKYGYVLIGMEGGSVTLREMLPGVPYFFGTLNYANWNQIPVLADLLDGLGVGTVAIMFVEYLPGGHPLLGIEYAGMAITELGKKGIDVVMIRSVPPGAEDVSSILLEAQALNADAFLSFCYPDVDYVATWQAISLDIDFDVFLLGPLACFDFYKDSFEDEFGTDAVEGVMGLGAWNATSSPGAAEFCDKFIARYGEGHMDWWGALYYWAGLQCLEQAIVEAGTLDQAAIKDVLATQTFDTVLGPTWFTTFAGGGGLLAVECHPGEIGQWQSGIFEVIDPGAKRTAPPIYPKPDW